MTELISAGRTGAAYIRVSTEEQTELSPDAQRRLILNYAEKNGIIIPEEYIFMENGISGKHAKKRPEFQRMIGLAKSQNHPFDVILVWKFSRFARNQEESIVYKSMLKKDRVDVISVSEPLADGPFGTLIERIIEWMDEYYSIRLSGEVLRGMTEKALRGGYQAAPPLGYRAVGGGKPPVVDEEEARLVKTIFEWFLEGVEVSAIARKLNEAGGRTKRGGRFESRTVRYILTNPFYMGKIRWTPGRDRERLNGDFSEAETIVADGVHTPLVSEDVFCRVQKRLEERQRTETPASRPAPTCPLSKGGHWLSGLLACPICGCNLSYSRAQYGSFQCWRYTKGLHAGSASLSVRKAETALVQSLKLISACQRPLAHFREKQPDRGLRLPLLEKELKRQRDRELRAREAFENGVDSLSEYEYHKQRLGERRARLEEELRQLSDSAVSPPGSPSPLSQVRSVLELIQSPDISPELKGTALRAALKRIIYQKETEEIHFYYYL